MSTIEKEHPELALHCAYLAEKYGVAPGLVTQRADVWSYGRLATSLNFVGCEVLMIDAEGHDTQILRSVIRHCRQDPRAWPGLIQFETMGHSDRFEGDGAEWKVIHSLEKAGYLLVGYSYRDTHLVRQEALRRDPRLRRWVDGWKCEHCMGYRKFPYVSTDCGIFCRRCVLPKRKPP